MTMVQQELRQQIDDLSSMIEAQRLVLSGLMNQRCQVQRQLNSVLDPMALLPLELQSKIFLHCLYHAGEGRIEGTPDPHLAPMLLLRVCQLWRDIALSTPELWNYLTMHWSSPPSGANDSDSRFFRMWLKRSQSFPLTLEWEGSSVFANGTQDLIDECGGRVETLTLLLNSIPPSGSHILRAAAPFPSLRKLTINCSAGRFEIRDWMPILKTSPILTHVTFLGSFLGPEIDTDSTAAFTLPALREFHFSPNASHPRVVNATRILKYITLPALEILHIRCHLNLVNGSEDLLAFLTRSSPPLRSLFFELDSLYWPSDSKDSLKYLRMVPNLTELSLGAKDTISVLKMLTRASDFLPNIRHLTLNPMSFLQPEDYEIIVRMLDARPLKSFRLNMMDPSAALRNATLSRDPAPSEHMIRELRRIRDSGISVYVGAGERIFV
ncbi:hypothetical protein R3P38DRAFT_3058084 [Favolaschia claudopus]|uniref:F-box domain-containing protein n=1 Tax=Favolaschia claudopus TaxID=2862362 RepID=A0AAW0A375_9AGAR